jgi:hypothetical protein
MASSPKGMFYEKGGQYGTDGKRIKKKAVALTAE